jgi:SEC-C motif-containing protein
MPRCVPACHRHVITMPLVQPFSSAKTPSRQSHRIVYCQSKGFGASSGGKTPSKQSACPCGSGEKYSACCKKYHDGEIPPTPEALMRSRYSAYSKGLVEYVIDTTHPDNPSQAGTVNPDGTPSSTLREDVVATCEKITWDKLKILSCEDGSSPDEAYVTFQTYFKTKGQVGQRAQGWHTQSFVEKSRFLKGTDGKWLYVDGEQDWKT